jgi:eukaryotic-like serine/threonine-protein kinase
MSTTVTPIPGFTPALTTASLSFTLGVNIGAGQGMNSEVYLAHDHQLDTQLVIKKVPKAQISASSDYFAEARRLYDSRHKHVVEVKYACENADHVFFAMPFYRGGSLHSLMELRFLTTREIVRYGLEFLSGLHHVHVKGLVHFDVKPSNVLLDDSDTAAIADFGLSREVTAVGLADMPLVYLKHMPPERASSAVVAKTADVYQAGVTLYRMCAGNAEYERQVASFSSQAALADGITAGQIPDRKRFLPHIPARLRTLVKTALSVNVGDRYQTVLDLMNALALVDQSLDWGYTQAGDWGSGHWYESDGSRGRRVRLNSSGQDWTVHATRLSPTGRESRVSSLCATGLNERASAQLINRALTEAWP